MSENGATDRLDLALRWLHRLSLGYRPPMDLSTPHATEIVAELERLRAIEAAVVALVEHWKPGPGWPGAAHVEHTEALLGGLSAAVRAHQEGEA